MIMLITLAFTGLAFVGFGVYLSAESDDFMEGAPFLVFGICVLLIGVALYSSLYGFNNNSKEDKNKSSEEVVVEEVEGDISNIVIVEDGKGSEEGEVKVEYKVDVDGVTHKRKSVVNEEDISRGEENKVVEEYVKKGERKVRNGTLDELVIEEGAE